MRKNGKASQQTVLLVGVGFRHVRVRMGEPAVGGTILLLTTILHDTLKPIKDEDAHTGEGSFTTAVPIMRGFFNGRVVVFSREIFSEPVGYHSDVSVVVLLTVCVSAEPVRRNSIMAVRVMDFSSGIAHSSYDSTSLVISAINPTF